MTRLITFAALAMAATTSIGIALADQGIPNVPARPVISMTAPGVAGEGYPLFGGQTRPVVSERSASNAGYQSYPDFIVPSSNERLGAAQLGRVQGERPMSDLATIAVPPTPQG